MNWRRRYLDHRQIGVVLLTSGGFLLLSLYARAWTEHNIFPILFPAVALSAWLAGRLGGLIATIALSLGTAYLHMEPEGFAVGDPADLIRLGTFTLSGTFVAWLSGALQESRGTMMATLRSIGDGVIATDRRGRVRFLNPVAETLTGWSQKEAKGRPLTEVFKGIDPNTREALEVPAPATLQGVVTLENACLLTKEGEQVAVDDSLAPVYVESGRVFGSILVFRDATRRKQSEAALLESQRRQLQAQRMEAVGRLAGGVAHDFNNLLTVIRGYADVSLRQMSPNSPGRSAIEEIRQAGERASNLTKQLLLFSRGQPTRLETVDLSLIVEGFEGMLRRLIGEDIQIVTNLSPDPIHVHVNVGQIEQVIMNLAANARDAMPRGGRLTLETRIKALGESGPVKDSGEQAAQYAVLAMTDTGIGMDKYTESRLFEPFFTTKEVGKGTGLGLSVIYGIVENHKGHLRVVSRPGEGSTFEVYLPLTERLPDAVPTAQSSYQLDAPGPATILLVEDNPDVRKLMTDALRSLGYVVLETADGEEALLMAEKHAQPIDLLITDIVMPGLSGFDIAKQLSGDRPGMRVLYVSGYADHESATRALADHTAGYLQKPFVLSELAQKVKAMISRSKDE
jgi:two-component system, cell cycle sensor histidine kinase and response regulator CckA